MTVSMSVVAKHEALEEDSPSPSPTGGRRPCILLAHGNAEMREYVSGLLSVTCDVMIVSNGMAALESAQAHAPDLVLSDTLMPQLDGFGLLRALRAGRATRSIPVILLAVQADQAQAVEGLNAGADDYVAKPFSSQELLARVHTHLEQARVRRAWSSELEQANRELETFSYSVSHDLRAPLRAIDGFSKLLIEEYGDRLDENGLRYLDRVRSGTQAMSSIINNLLCLSRVSRGLLRLQTLDLSAMVRHILDGLIEGHPARAVKLEIEDGLTAEADRRLMKIILLNLIDNSWKYTTQRSPAVIAFGRKADAKQHVFYVRDNGAGFDSAYTDKLFKPFQRLDSVPEFTGAGIGLATAYRAITRHGGRIWAESKLNGGATFYFTLGENA